MAIKPVRDKQGVVIYFNADAGRGAGENVRFKVQDYENEKQALAAAEAFVAEVRYKKKANSDTGANAQLYRAIQILDGKLSLVEAAEVAMKSVAKKAASDRPWTFSEAASEMLAHQEAEGCESETLRSTRGCLDPVAKVMGDKLLDQITVEDLLAFLKVRDRVLEQRTKRKGLSPSARNNYRKYLSMLFNFAIKRKRCTENPAKLLPSPKEAQRRIKTEPVAIFTPDQVRALLEQCDARIIPYMTLSLFTGLRPTEAMAVRAEHVNWESRQIKVISRKARGRRRRFVTLNDTLYAWLWPARQLIAGVLPVYNQVRTSRDAAAERAKLDWTQDILRHCFCSYHLNYYQDVAKTQYEMGHDSQQVIFSNYHDLVTKEVATEFWGILPATCNFDRLDTREIYAIQTKNKTVIMS